MLPFAEGKSKEFSGHKAKVHSLQWSCDGTKLASGSSDGSIRIWHIDRLLESSGSSRDLSSELKGHSSSTDQLKWSPTQGELLASVSSDRTLRFWDTTTMVSLKCVQLSSEGINLSWSRNGSILAVGCKDDTLLILDVATRRIVKSHHFSQEINEMVWSLDGEKLFITRGTGSVDIINPEGMTMISSTPAHTANCYCIDMSADGKRIAVGAADALVSIWNCEEMCCERTVCRLDWPIRAISFNADGSLLAAASEDSFIDVSLVSSGELLVRIPVTAAINALAWHPKMDLLAYAGDHVDNRSNRATGSIFIFS